MDISVELARHIVGCQLMNVERHDYDWLFSFARDTSLQVSCPWRILVSGGIALTNTDYDQQFGLPAPIDAEEMAGRLLGQMAIKSVSIRGGIGDLSIAFDNGAVLEVINMSSGYEGWQIGVPGLNVIAQGAESWRS